MKSNWTELGVGFSVEYVHRTGPFAFSYFTVFKESNMKTVRLANERFGIYICSEVWRTSLGREWETITIRLGVCICVCVFVARLSFILDRCCFDCDGGGGDCCCCCSAVTAFGSVAIVVVSVTAVAKAIAAVTVNWLKLDIFKNETISFGLFDLVVWLCCDANLQLIVTYMV